VEAHQCRQVKNAHVLGESGYLTRHRSSYSKETGYSNCRFLIDVEKGRRINLTLFDFSAFTALQKENTLTGGKCRLLAIIVEPVVDREINVCGGGRSRILPLYLSVANQVQIELIEPSGTDDGFQFLIQFQGTIEIF